MEKKDNSEITQRLMKAMSLDSFASSFAILVIITIIAAFFWETVNREALLAWLLSLYTIIGIRSYFAKRFLEDKISLQKIVWIFNGLTILALLFISTALILLFLHTDYQHQAFLIIIMVGISSGAIISLSYFKRLSLSYILIITTPFLYVLLTTHESPFFHSLTYLIFLFLIMMSFLSIRYNRNILNSIKYTDELLQTTQELEVSKNNFESIFKELPTGLFTYNQELVVLQVNKALESFVKAPQEKIINFDLKTLKDTSFVKLLDKVFLNETVHYEGTYTTTFSKLNMWIKLHAIPIYDTEGKIIAGLGMMEDITQQVQYQEELKQHAFYDELTGLTNRTSLSQFLEQFTKRLHRQQGYGVLLFIDLDDFKNINDSLGHDTGDSVLQEFANRIKKALRIEDIFARLGGDEFVILLSQTDNNLAKISETAYHLSEKIHQLLKEPLHTEQTLYITVSIGIKILTPEETNVSTILKHADIAMYESKKLGKNRTSFYKSDMSKQMEHTLLLYNELQIAIQKEQFELYLQPIVDLKTDKIISAEALIRWNHPTKGLIFPDAFIEFAETNNHIIIAIGKWVIERAFEIYKELDGALEDIAINISVKQFHEENFVEFLLENAKKYNTHPSAIKLELTESLALTNVNETIDKMLLLKSYGFKFSMDDFGTGYSSLSYLDNLPFDYLKIDQSFVLSMFENEKDKKLVQIIIEVAQQFGFLIIAEGVETRKHVEFMKEHGCDYYAKNGANRTLMPVQFGHPCRFKSDSDVGNDSDILE